MMEGARQTLESEDAEELKCASDSNQEDIDASDVRAYKLRVLELEKNIKHMNLQRAQDRLELTRATEDNSRLRSQVMELQAEVETVTSFLTTMTGWTRTRGSFQIAPKRPPPPAVQVPEVLVHELAPLLGRRSLMKLRAVCRHWRLLVDEFVQKKKQPALKWASVCLTVHANKKLIVIITSVGHNQMSKQRVHSDWVMDCVFSPDGRRLVTVSKDLAVRVWRMCNGTLNPEQTLSGHLRTVTACVFSPDGAVLVTVSEDMTARVWDASVSNWVVLHTLRGHGASVLGCAYCPTGDMVATVSLDRTTRVWDPNDRWIPLITLEGHTGAVVNCAFSPSGHCLVTTSEDRSVVVWNTKTWLCICALNEHTMMVAAARFSPDGSALVTVSADATAMVWQTSDWTRLATLSGHCQRLQSCAFSPDGMSLVTISRDQTARVWVADSGSYIDWAHVCTLETHNGDVGACVFDPNGSNLATISADGRLYVWSDM